MPLLGRHCPPFLPQTMAIVQAGRMGRLTDAIQVYNVMIQVLGQGSGALVTAFVTCI